VRDSVTAWSKYTQHTNIMWTKLVALDKANKVIMVISRNALACTIAHFYRVLHSTLVRLQIISLFLVS
jgi:hypothetical protein